MIPEGFITQLLDRVNIVDVIEKRVPLKRRGRNWQACCPFHKEKTPSFSVSQDKQIYKCFGCGASGSAIKFLMDYEGLSFVEAVKSLAADVHMDVPETGPRISPEVKAANTVMLEMMHAAQEFYRVSLAREARGRDYAQSRRLSPAILEKYAIGYAPAGYQNLESVLHDGYKSEHAQTCGLVTHKGERTYDMFRDRLMFPIRNRKGEVIGFGGRVLDKEQQPKYLNTAETPIFHKGSELYGLYEGEKAIREKKRVIVTEGYMDVVQLAQAGFEESVAALGTSLTEDHVQKLFRLTDEVYFCFDGDAAGQRAAQRALAHTLKVITDTQKAGFIVLPPEHDPDSLIKEQGPQAFEQYITHAVRLTDFLKTTLLKDKDLSFAEDRARYLHQAQPYLASMERAPFLKATLTRELAEVGRVTTVELSVQSTPEVPRTTDSTTRSPWTGTRPWRGRGQFGASSKLDSWAYRDHPLVVGASKERLTSISVDSEARMVQLFLVHPNLLTTFDVDIVSNFFESKHELLLTVWRARHQLGNVSVTTAQLMQALSSSPLWPRYEMLLDQALKLESREEIAQCELKRLFLTIELDRLHAAIEDGVNKQVPFEELIPLVKLRQALHDEMKHAISEAGQWRRRADEEMMQAQWKKKHEEDTAQVSSPDSGARPLSNAKPQSRDVSSTPSQPTPVVVKVPEPPQWVDDAVPVDAYEAEVPQDEDIPFDPSSYL